MVDLLSHIETTQISKSNLLNLAVHLTILVILIIFSSNAHPHYNNHLMVKHLLFKTTHVVKLIFLDLLNTSFILMFCHTAAEKQAAAVKLNSLK